MSANSSYRSAEKQSATRTVALLFAGMLLGFLFPFKGMAKDDPVFPFDEILVFMNVQGAGSAQVPAAIRNETAYLAVTDVFDFLKIRNTASSEMDSISGFFITPQATFVIDKKNNRIEYQNKKITLPADAFISTPAALYLRSDLFGQVFGLHCKFNFRSLSVVVSCDQELPIIREMRQEAMRNNLERLKGDAKADTLIPHRYQPFRMGMADWAVINTQDLQQKLTDTRVNLSLGAVVAGGETDVSLNYRNSLPLDEKQQYYQWRYTDNDNAGMRQFTAGKVFMPSISSIYAPVVGVQFTNAPSVYRRSFGTYTLSYYTEAGWIAELYVNNTLVNYSKADATGLATFQVPLVYGNSVVKIKFYSPWGEERVSEQNIQIPFNFLPFHEFEYTASAGMVEDSLHSRFSRVSTNYGVSSRLTMGAGVEYLSSVANSKIMPFVNASFRVRSNLLLSGEYAYGVRSKFTGSWHLRSDLQVEAIYTRYKEGQKAINNSFLEERKAVISYPFRSRKFSLFSRLSAYQIVLPVTKYTGSPKYATLEGLLSGVLFGVNTNMITYALLTDQARPFVYSNLSMAFRLPGKVLFTPQLQYEYNAGRLMGVRAEMGKYIGSRGYVNAFYENNYKSGFQSLGLGLRFDFSFAVTGLSFTRGNHQSGNMVQSASGSILYDQQNRHLNFSNRTNVGKGAVTVLSFLDLNNNAVYDYGEPKVKDISINMNGGRVQYNKHDSSLQVTDLEAYASYTLTITEKFQNVAWHIRNKVIRIAVDPNQFKVVEVPVTVYGEVAGTVYMQEDSVQKPLSRVMVSIYRKDYTLAAQVLTEADGSFDFNGLLPGKYTAQVNADQLQKLHMKSLPWSLPFTITGDRNGDFVDGLKFILKPL